MISEGEVQRKHDYRFLMVTNSLCLVLFVFLFRNDFSLVSTLMRYSDSVFAVYTDQTIFGGENVGLSDIPIFINIFVLFVGLCAKFSSKIADRWILIAKYLISTNLIFGLLIIHGLKNIVGRARPYLALNDTSLYTDFWEFGVFDFLQHSFSGSLPSGHTATVLALLPLIFCIRFTKNYLVNDMRRIIGFSFVLVLSLVMALGRVMIKDHFLSDCILTIFLGWNFHYFMFYFVYNMPVRLRNGVTQLGVSRTLYSSLVLALGLGALYLMK